MTAQRHIIKRQVFELRVGSTTNTQQLHDDMSRLYRQRIVPLIERYCSELSAPERIHRIDSLEINLGTLRPQHLEEDLVATVNAQLRALLAEHITTDERQAEQAGINRQTASHLELCSVFAHTGNLPWWADTSSSHLLDHALQYLLHHAPGPLRQWLRDLAPEQRSLQRLLHHGDDPLLANLAAVLAPSLDLAALTPMVHDLLVLLRRTTSGVAQSRTRLRHRVWSVILHQASVQGEQATTWPSFFQAILTHLARDLGVAYAALLSDLQQAVQQDHAAFLSPLTAFLRPPGGERSQAGEDPIRTVSPSVPQDSLPPAGEDPGEEAFLWTVLMRLLQVLLAQFPESGQASLWSALDHLARRPADQAAGRELLQTLRSAPVQQHLPALLTPSDPPLPVSADPRAGALQWTALLPLLRALLAPLPGPSQAPLLTALDRLARRPADQAAGRELLQVLRAASVQQHLPPALLPGWRAALEAPAGAASAPPHLRTRTASRQAVAPQESSPLDLTFSDTDALYIDNAGLVILHPFLRHFFARLDLLADTQFKDIASRQRAVGLLQYLVNAESSPPEYLLALNKTLCGMDLEDVFDFDPPVTEAEAEECTNLLTAVIANAPILKNMSLPGLRGTFLRRQGVLSRRDGMWLLRVERETYDVVLDRFPWTIQWVKLPWMEAPLQIEW